MLIVFQSNRLEVLADHLVEVLSEPLTSPFSTEQIVVQHPGMGRWLNYRVADAFGIAANIDYSLPAAFLWQLYRNTLDLNVEKTPLDREQLQWIVFGHLLSLPDSSEFRPLHDYLGSDVDELRAWQLAVQLADCIDRYMLYRPDWITAWEQGNLCDLSSDEPMFACLWRLITNEQAMDHRVRMQHQFSDRYLTNQLDLSNLPERLLLFGVDTLPPAQLEHISAVSREIPVYLFVLNPSGEFWQDVRSRREQIKIEQRNDLTFEENYLSEGNRLLATMGGTLQDFLQCLDQYDYDDRQVFQNIEKENLLTCLQHDVLALKNSSLESEATFLFDENDGSIQIRSCHTRTRELEVLQDYLLHLLDNDADLNPRDIVVMAPDINQYAPMIDAIFERHDERYIGYTVADRLATQSQPLLQAFIDILRFPSSRFTASDVLDLLFVDAVSKRFGLTQDDQPLLRQWIENTGVRWGIDGSFKQLLDLPDANENTWKSGFEQLLLGYAMGGGSPEINGIHPYSDIEGISAENLGALMDLLSILDSWREQASSAATASQWLSRLHDLIETLFVADIDDQPALFQVTSALKDFVETVESAGLGNQHFGLPVLIKVMEPKLQEPGPRNRFLSGKLTFCNLQPMRSLPFKVVCLLGMNDADFPRSERPFSFDLMGNHRRLCDRSRREDDRYLFLQAILSARQNLYISYEGRSVKDNCERQPSVLVIELLDYLAEMLGIDVTDARQKLVTEMPLQPFSFSCFDEHLHQGLWSYAKEWASGAQARLQTSEDTCFYDQPLMPANIEERQFNTHELIRFFECPARFFLNHNLGVTIPRHTWSDTLQQLQIDLEPFQLDGLSGWEIKQASIDTFLETQTLQTDDFQHVLPQGEVADLYIESLTEELSALRTQMKDSGDLDHYLAAELYRGEIQLGNEYSLSSKPLAYHDGKYISVSPGKMRAKHLIDIWVHHLTAQLVLQQQGGVEGRIYKEGEKAPVILPPVPEERAQQQLELLFAWFVRGHNEPLPFFPETSLIYQQSILSLDDIELAQHKARNKYEESSQYSSGEGLWLANRLLFSHQDPVCDDTFVQLAEEIYKPVLSMIHSAGEDDA